MNKIVIAGLIVAGGLVGFSTAQAATYARDIMRATLVGVVEREGQQFPVHKVVDGANTCYVFGASISCLK